MVDSFEAFKSDIFGHWRKRFSKISVMIASIVFIGELAIFFYYLFNGNIKHQEIQYLLLRVILPSSLNGCALGAHFIIIKSDKFNERIKNYSIIYSIFILCSVVAIFHNFFNFLLVVLTLPIYLCSVFADRKLMNSIFIATWPVTIVAMAVLFLDKVGFDTQYRISTMACCVIYIIVTYIFSMANLRTQEEQINYVYSSYLRQNELIEKLKIEPLTHLYNRSALDEAIKASVERYSVTKRAPTLALIDLDHFKNINDTYGHANGDIVLITLSNVIQNNLGGSRNAFRFGGEEFIIIFDKNTDEECYSVIQNIKDDFTNHSYDFAPGSHFSLSAGIVKYREEWTAYDWFDKADDAMYTSKQNGRNMITVK